MHQVLFTVPVFTETFPPDGIPVFGFGAMLFITFIVVTWWGGRRAVKVGMPKERFQDLAIWLFVSGIVGARVLYMIQYSHQFPDKSLLGLAGAFFQIWKGGIIFYGSALGGAIGYGLFYWYVLRKLKVSGWQLADAVAPLLAAGLAIGRVGCYLNGCCWGQVAIEEACPVPLGGAHFPILPAHARDQMVAERVLQTSTGFTVAPRNRAGIEDPRSVVKAVEPGSAAAAVGLKPNDLVVKVNGRPNAVVLEIAGPPDKVKAAQKELLREGATVETAEYVESLWPWKKGWKITKVTGADAQLKDLPPDRNPRAYFDDVQTYLRARVALAEGGNMGVTLTPYDLLWETAREWPRGQNDLTLTVERDGQATDLPPFSPRTVALYPTQLYETVSMILLILLLLAFHPFRRHDGQLMTLCMAGYAVHRFINESLRVEPSIGLGLTLSQWGSVVILAAAVGIELYLWRVMPSRWATTPPATEPAKAPDVAPSPAPSTAVPPGPTP